MMWPHKTLIFHVWWPIISLQTLTKKVTRTIAREKTPSPSFFSFEHDMINRTSTTGHDSNTDTDTDTNTNTHV